MEDMPMEPADFSGYNHRNKREKIFIFFSPLPIDMVRKFNINSAGVEIETASNDIETDAAT
jgi:hypothetical protein